VRTPIRAAFALALLASAAAPLRAQFAYVVKPSSEQCLATLPRDGFARVPVVLVPTIGDTTQRAIVPQVALLLQSVVEFARTRAGMSADSVPPGEPALDWRQLIGDLLVVAHRDGRLAWRVDNNTGGRALGDSAARWLAGALSAARDAKEAFFAWPDGLRGDSAVVRVAFMRPWVDATGAVQPLRAELPVSAFTLAVPRETPVRVEREPRIHFPDGQLRVRGAARIVLQFVVDTTGRIEAGSVHEVLPDAVARDPMFKSSAYLEFLKSVTDGLLTGRYLPARVGACTLPQLVQQAFEFGVR
jgi:hypothetical protein